MTSAPAARTAARTAALVAATSLALAGCVGIPTDGPVGSGEVVVSEEGSITLFANDPVPDAGPEEIISGFLQAVDAGIYDDYSAARNHLTSGAARQWDPRARVVVYRGVPEITAQDDGSYLVTVEVDVTLDDAGRYVAAAPGSEEVVTFELARGLGDQWRIATPPVGALVTVPTFDQAYRRTPVYFATADRTHLVPDVRWFPARFQATSAVEALLGGASPWLRDAVVTGAPEGARLSTTAVTVTAGVAHVDLTSQARLADAEDRALLQAQLEATLSRLPGVVVDEVQVAVGGVVTDFATARDLVRDPGPDSGPYVVTDDGIAVLDGGEIVPLRGLSDVAGTTALAVGADGRTTVALDADGRLLLLPEGGSTPVPLLDGAGWLRPGADRHGWFWTARADGDTLTAVRADGTAAGVGGEWLAGRVVRAVLPSRDGARVAVVSVGADGVAAVDVAAVVRAEDGAPRRLGEPVPLAPTLADPWDVAWVDEATVAVLTRAEGVGQVHLVPVTGPVTDLSPVEGATALAAGRGERGIYLVTDDGRLLVRQTRGWSGVAEDVRAVAFPG